MCLESIRNDGSDCALADGAIDAAANRSSIDASTVGGRIRVRSMRWLLEWRPSDADMKWTMAVAKVSSPQKESGRWRYHSRFGALTRRDTVVANSKKRQLRRLPSPIKWARAGRESYACP